MDAAEFFNRAIISVSIARPMKKEVWHPIPEYTELYKNIYCFESRMRSKKAVAQDL